MKRVEINNAKKTCEPCLHQQKQPECKRKSTKKASKLEALRQNFPSFNFNCRH